MLQTIAVIGAGTMGNGIAHVVAQHGFTVHLTDTRPEALEQAIRTISHNLDRQLSKQVIGADDKAATLANITPFHSLEESIADAQLVIEAATERAELKLDIFRQLDEAAPPDCILASNTSSISITRIAAATRRPEKVIGMHFMNPVPVMRLVEIINGYATEAAVTAQIVALSKQLGKVPCVVNDYPGFIANRILMPMINEAVYSLFEGVAGVEEIDTIMQLGMAHPMGPLRLADLIGLDTCVAIMNVMRDGLGKPQYSPCPLLTNMVEAGKLGVKTGEGFYDYSKNAKQPAVSARFL